MKLRIATLNIWGRFGDWSARSRVLRDSVRSLCTDVLLCQEVLHDQVQEVAELVACEHVAWSPGHEGPHGAEGVAIFSRLPLHAIETNTLPTSMPSRVVISARVGGADEQLTVASGHTALWPLTTRAEHVAAILSRPETPLVIGADLNMEPHEVEHDLMIRKLCDALSDRDVHTWPSSAAAFSAAWEQALGAPPEFSLARRRIDFLVHRGVRIRAADAVFLEGPDGVAASDHAAVWADVVVGADELVEDEGHDGDEGRQCHGEPTDKEQRVLGRPRVVPRDGGC